MSATIFSKQITDTSTYSTSIERNGTEDLFHVVNDLDAEITVTFYGTRSEDTDRTDTEQLGSLTLGAGGSNYETLADPWEVTYIEVVASTSPTSGEANIYRMS